MLSTNIIYLILSIFLIILALLLLLSRKSKKKIAPSPLKKGVQKKNMRDTPPAGINPESEKLTRAEQEDLIQAARHMAGNFPRETARTLSTWLREDEKPDKSKQEK